MIDIIKKNTYAFFRLLIRKLMFLWVKVHVYNNNYNIPTETDAKIIYILRMRSFSDLLVLDNECIKAKLVRPRLCSSKNSYGNPCLFIYSHQGLIFQRTISHLDELSALINKSIKEPSTNIYIQPISVFWGRSPDKEQSPFKLLFAWNYNIGGRLRKFFSIILHGRHTMLLYSPPLSLKKLLSENLSKDRTLRKVSRIVRVHFNEVRRSVIGPDLSHKRTLVNTIIAADQVKSIIRSKAILTNSTYEDISKEAQKYALEIVSDFSYPIIRCFDIILTWFWNKIYDGVEINNIESVQKLSTTHELIYVPCHRSHIDYLLLSYVLYYQGLQIPHITAGINLNMPIIGSLLRRCGAFFMRRSFKGNQLYSAVLHEYLFILFTRGFPTEYFIEGGRSRTGRTLKPKMGMLQITLRSYFRNSKKPIVFIPVYIGYEKIIEINTYLGELHGKSKRKESPMDIMRTILSLKQSLGRAFVNFGKPIQLNDFLDKELPAWRDNNIVNNQPKEWIFNIAQKLGVLISMRINSAAAITPINMMAIILLSTTRQAIGKEELIYQINFYLSLMDQHPLKNTIMLPKNRHAGSMIDKAEQLGVANRTKDNMGDIIFMDEKQSIMMTYYRNNILHLFAIPSLISRFFITNKSSSTEEVIEFSEIFFPYLKSELFIETSIEDLENDVINWINALEKSQVITKNDVQKWEVDESCLKGYFMLILLSRPIQQTIERLYVVSSLLINNGSGNTKTSDLKQISQDVSQRLSIIQGWKAPEFFDSSLFIGLIETLQNNQVIWVTDNGRIEFGQSLITLTSHAKKILPRRIHMGIHQIASY